MDAVELAVAVAMLSILAALTLVGFSVKNLMAEWKREKVDGASIAFALWGAGMGVALLILIGYMLSMIL